MLHGGGLRSGWGYSLLLYTRFVQIHEVREKYNGQMGHIMVKLKIRNKLLCAETVRTSGIRTEEPACA